MFDYDILLINPPLLTIEPDYLLVGSLAKCRMKTINPGILSIGSYLDYRGFQTKILDLSESSDFTLLKQEMRKEKPRVVGISSETGFNYLETLKCARIVKNESPESLCIAGGYHIGPLGRIALRESESLDLVVRYEGEWLSEQIIKNSRNVNNLKKLPGIVLRKEDKIYNTPKAPPTIDLNEMPFMNFDLYPDYKEFIPFIEESRGCPYRCNYCPNSYVSGGKCRIKKSSYFAAELDNTIGFFGNEVIYAVLASTFGLNTSNSISIANELHKRGVEWITETRPDTQSNKHLKRFSESGLRVLSLGMETASPEILLRMGKTNEPLEWISRTQKLVKEASKLENLKLRTNVMLYIGETPQTVKQTIDFLCKYSYGISLAPAMSLFVVPGSHLMLNFIHFQEKFGCKLVKTEYSKKTHLFPCHLSTHFSYEEAAYLCNTIEKIFSAD